MFFLRLGSSSEDFRETIQWLPMRVYFVGAHSTGKTTMARYVAKKYQLPMISEVARAVLAELELDFQMLRTDLEKVGMYQQAVFKRQVESEKQAGKNFVSDRAFDNLAYAAEHTFDLPIIAHGATDLPSYLKWVSEGIVFFIRPHKHLMREDGVREETYWESVIRIDGMVKFMLEYHRVPYLPIETSSMQERARIVDYTVSRARDQEVREDSKFSTR